MSSLLWYAFLLVTGSGSTAVEIAGLRLLAPVFGSSLPVWGLAISAVIGGLAIGYSFGGKRARRPVTASDVARRAALGAVLFLWLPAVFALAAAASLPAAVPISFFALLIPSVVFGMVSPLASEVEAKRLGQSAGQVTGRVFMLTTIGSLIGIILPSFITIPLLGTRETSWLFAGAVLCLAVPFLFQKTPKQIPVLLLAAALGAGISFIRIPHPNEVFADETPYQFVSVRQVGEKRHLVFDAGLGVQSVYTPTQNTGGYWDYLAQLPRLLPPQNQYRVLVLGSAASTTERQLKTFWEGEISFDFVSVELDGALFAIVDKYFDPPARRQITGDARRVLNTLNETFDIIVVDAYTRELTIPFHLATAEFFAEAGAKLKTGGILAVNANSVSPDSLLLTSLNRALQSAFPHTSALHVPNSCNYLLLASRAPIPQDENMFTPRILGPNQFQLEDGLLLTDNRSPVELLGLSALITSHANACS